jgi:hypothetical protein
MSAMTTHASSYDTPQSSRGGVVAREDATMRAPRDGVTAAAVVARKTWRTLEPIHGMIYFAPEAAEEYATLGVTGRSGYFGSRAAPMGAVGAEVVVATFFNFHPDLVRRAMESVWSTTSPGALHAARVRAVDLALRRAFGDTIGGDDLARAAHLARRAAEAATELPEGRPLFAGHAALEWPTERHLELWHAQTLLREFRGDGHVAMLVSEGLSGLDALILHAATGEVPRAALQLTRSWSDGEWDAAVAALHARGVVHADGSFTDDGRRLRDGIEAATDRLAAAPYTALGDDGCTELRTLARPFSKQVIDGGLLTVDPKRFLEAT